MARALSLLLTAALALSAGACAKRGLSSRPAPGAPVPAAVPTAAPTPAPSFPQAQPVDESKPVKVRSARLRHDQGLGLTVFYGGVTVTHDTSVLNAAELHSRDQGATAEALGGVKVRDSRRHFSAEAGRLRYANALQEGQLEDGVRLVTLGPYGQPVTVTGRSGGYHGLSRSAWVDGGVQASSGTLSVTARRADLAGDGERVDLSGGVDARLGGNRALADSAQLLREGQSLELSGTVRARFVPSQLRSAAERPWQADGPKEEP